MELERRDRALILERSCVEPVPIVDITFPFSIWVLVINRCHTIEESGIRINTPFTLWLDFSNQLAGGLRRS